MTTVEANSRVAASGRSALRGGALSLVGHQLRFELLMFWRNRQSRFFTVALPVIFLLIFASIWRGDTVTVAGGTIDESVYYVPGIITLGIVSAAFNNLVISVTASRESGILKRRRATPVPAAVLIAARALTAMVVALAMTAILLLIGWAAFGATVPARTAPALVLAVLVGAAAFCCLGFAVASVISNADSAQPLTQAIILPLYFISGVFIPLSTMPGWLTDIASYFPVRHLAESLLTAYNPHTTGDGVAWAHLGIVALWGVTGLLVALRRFSWLPRSHR
jgi:ABC-2 type transport system permease protein